MFPDRVDCYVLGIDVLRFDNEHDSIANARADVVPDCLDLIISITDVLKAVTGFPGLGYPYGPTAADPCDSTCVSPLP